MISSQVIWRSVTIAMAVAGVVLLGVLYAIGQWGACCAPGIGKPITGESTWARPSNPWIFGQAPAPTEKAHHRAKVDKGASGATANPADLLAAVKFHGKGSGASPPHGSTQVGDTGPSESPLPPRGGPTSGNPTPTNTCSSVINVLTGLASAECAQGAGGDNGSSDNDDSSGNGNHHSSNHGGSSDNANADASALTILTAGANDNSSGSDNGKHNGADKGNKNHGASSQAKNHGNKHH